MMESVINKYYYEFYCLQARRIVIIVQVWRKKKSSCPESSRHPTENYYAHAASFTQKHTIVEKLPTSAFAVPHLCRASAFEMWGHVPNAFRASTKLAARCS